MSPFEEGYAQLNTNQRAAVDAIDGPVLVIAGPGTGKTQLLSMRVANILRHSDADARNILCLTFTNKAAANMRDRLVRLVGPEANKVTVKTFHGFAAELMANNPDYFWNGARLSTAPDAIQLEIIMHILETLPLNNPLSLKFFGKFTGVDDTLKALRLSKEAGLTPEKLRAIIEINLAYIKTIEDQLVKICAERLSASKLDQLRAAIEELPEQGIDAHVAPLLSLTAVIRESLDDAIKRDEETGKTKNVSKWKARWIQTVGGQKGMFDERRRNEWWLAFCEVYQAYRDQLHERGYYDYSDMLLEVITQLEQKEDFRAQIQEQYQYVLIDEFQDSNAAQLRLAHLVADHHTSEGAPNIMAVGDDDQSIFGFNGAELNNLLFFNRNYRDTKLIVLTDNYRSSQAVLDTAEQIINQAEDRLVNRLPGLTKQLSTQNAPTISGTIAHHVYPTREQQISSVARQIQTNTVGTTAVIARSHESLRNLASILLDLGVPLRYEQQSNILEHEVVQLITQIAEVVVAIQEGNRELTNEKLAVLVVHPIWQFVPQKLWHLALQNYKQPDWLESLCTSEDEGFKQLGQWLQWMAAEASYQPLHITIERLVGLTASTHMTSPIREYYLKNQTISNEYLQALSAVRLLRELVNEYQNQGGIKDFVQFIHVNNQNGRGIADESIFVSSGQAVELLTVHKAKGLEFDTVYIIDAVEDNWKPRSVGRKPPANLPLQPPGEVDDDYIRLLYVAATRAKHTLYVTSYTQNVTGGDILPTPYIRNCLPETVMQGELIPVTQTLEEHLRWPRLSSSDEKSLLRTRLESFSLSATQLLTFLDVTNGGPQYFLERHLLRLPEASSPQQAYGSAMHSALQYAQKLVNQDAFNPDEVAAAYERALKTQHLSATDYERYLKHGTDITLRICNEFDLGLRKGGQAEQSFNDIRIGHATVNGFIDRLDTTGDTALITDYKTGIPLSSFTTRDQTKAIKAWRHKTQLIFYATVLAATGKYQSIDAQMIYLEAEQPSDLIRTYTPTAQDIERMQKLINATWDHIISLNFPDITKYPENIQGILAFEDDLLS